MQPVSDSTASPLTPNVDELKQASPEADKSKLDPDFFQWSKGAVKLEIGCLLNKDGYTEMHKLSPEIIEAIAKDCPNLRHLTIKKAENMDGCIPHLKNFSKLRRLRLYHSDITGFTLESLPLTIEKIELVFCPNLQDRAIIQLAQRKPKKLYVCECAQITPQAFFGMPHKTSLLYQPSLFCDKSSLIAQNWTYGPFDSDHDES